MGTWALSVVDWFLAGVTSIVNGAFESLTALIISPLGGLIIFGLSIGYLMHVRKMSSSNNAR